MFSPPIPSTLNAPRLKIRSFRAPTRKSNASTSTACGCVDKTVLARPCIWLSGYACQDEDGVGDDNRFRNDESSTCFSIADHVLKRGLHGNRATVTFKTCHHYDSFLFNTSRCRNNVLLSSFNHRASTLGNRINQSELGFPPHPRLKATTQLARL